MKTIGKYQLKSNRLQQLKENVLSKTPSVCIERARYVTEAYKENEAQSVYIKRAKALQKTLEKMSIYIKEGELVVGNQACDERTAPIFPEYAVQWMEDELKEKGNFNKREGDNFYLPEEHHKELLEIVQYWKGKTLQDKCKAMMPEEVSHAAKAKAIHGDGNMTSGDGHIVPDFEKALAIGLEGIIDEAKKKLATIDVSENDGLRKRAYLESTILVNEATIAFARRYAHLATLLAEKERDIERKKELLNIACICNRVPAKAPRSFYEAVQMIWFIHLVIQIESNGHSASLGRVDQYLYRYYIHDVEEQMISRDFAKELLQCLWVKLYSIIKIRPTSHAGYGAGYPTYQNVTIGGMNEDFSDQVNELSFLILESVAEAKLTQPNLSARVHNNSSEKYLRLCAEVAATGYGMPAFHNDEIIIPALLNRGVSYKDAFNYTMVGCVEVAVPGKWGYRCTGMSFLNLLKVTELTLSDGFDSRTNQTLLTGNGKLTDFTSYEEVFEAYKKNLQYYTKQSVVLDKVADTNLLDYPDMFLSSLIDDCIGRCKTAKEGGAIYDIVSGLQVGIANAANSLAALKKVVFEDKLFTTEQISKALETNFEGAEGQRIRQVLLDVPKFGNDESYVDDIAKAIYDVYVEEMQNYHTTRYGQGPIGGNYSFSTSGISSNVPMGTSTAATPDGRYAYLPAAEGASPVQGTDREGPTSVLKSVSKLPNILMIGGQLLNIKFPPAIVENEVGFDKFVMLLKSFIRMRGWHVQFNIISTDVLRKAQQNPEEYRDVIVRVAGYCAQFVTLDPVTQEDIISRTEQSF